MFYLSCKTLLLKPICFQTLNNFKLYAKDLPPTTPPGQFTNLSLPSRSWSLEISWTVVPWHKRPSQVQYGSFFSLHSRSQSTPIWGQSGVAMTQSLNVTKTFPDSLFISNDVTSDL